ncbi:MAG: hypothetical protein Q8K67_03615 [Geothrix sp.]|nr:hypothetical protein [Geothrix sp.]
METKPILTEADHRATLLEIKTLMTATAGTPEGDRLEVLVALVEAYERIHFSMDPPDPRGGHLVQYPHKRIG